MSYLLSEETQAGPSQRVVPAPCPADHEFRPFSFLRWVPLSEERERDSALFLKPPQADGCVVAELLAKDTFSNQASLSRRRVSLSLSLSLSSAVARVSRVAADLFSNSRGSAGRGGDSQVLGGAPLALTTHATSSSAEPETFALWRCAASSRRVAMCEDSFSN